MNLTKPQMLVYNMEKVSGGAISTICGRVLTKGIVDEEKIKAVINNLFEKNDSFRVRFFEQNGETHQEVHPYKKKEIDILHFESTEQLDEFCNCIAKQPIDIHGELAEIKGIVVGDEYGFIVKAHHTVSDGWALSLLVSQFVSLMNGEEIETHSYLDYVETEKKYLSSKRLEKDENYWKEVLAKCDEPVFLNEKTAETNLAESTTFVIGKEQTSLISVFAKETENSIYNILMTAVCVYFNKVKNNAEKFFIGTASLNRSNNAEKNTMGMFVNTVPILIELNNNESFEKNIEAVSSESMTAFRHQRYNYLDVLKLHHQSGRQDEKLFDVIFSYQNARIGEKQDLLTIWFGSGIQNESLQIHVDDRDCDGTLNIKYDFQTEKFAPKDIEQIHSIILSLLFDAIDDYNAKKETDEECKPLFELSSLCPKQYEKIISDFNRTEAPYPKDKCVHELFEEQAERQPNKTAVIASDRTITYKELNEEANKIANSLIQKGIKQDDIVAFSLSRKSTLLAVILGILKTGAAYLPLDPEYPNDRIQYMLADSNAVFFITEENIGEILNTEKHDNPKILVSSNSICYCIYTSGSTGKPKGTLLRHQNAVNFAFESKNNIVGNAFENSYSIASTSAITFDMSVTETLLPLMNGMTIILADEKQSKFQKDFNRLLLSHPADIIEATPTKLKLLISEETETDFLKNVKTIILGGEAFDLNLYSRLKELTKAKIYNFYGPTETTVWSSFALVESDDITIGKPIANTQIYILDKFGKVVPFGVIGELCIAGDGVGAGYLNRPELTEEKFISNPYGQGKLYKTGDLAYLREDGNIVYIGRNDFQVKIRGQRIELGEIESAIMSIDGISLCAVTVRKNEDGRQFICAFYSGRKKSDKEIKEVISKKLAKYMVPHIFTYLDKLPLTTSGKIDRKSLPKVDLQNFESEVEFVEPTTKQEKIVADSIKSVLGAKQVGLLDNFFDKGGDSLKAIELVSKLESYGCTVEIKTVFDCENVKELSEKLTAKEERIHLPYSSVMPAASAQMRVYTAQNMNGDSTLYNIPYIFKVDSLDKDKLQTALNRLIARHESLRTHFENRDGEIHQVIDETAKVKLQKLDSDDISSFIKPFDLSVSPLIHAGFFENTVMIDLHHIIADGESLPVFYRELNELYMGREIKTEATQYGEFAVSSAYTEENENYWKKVFSGEVPTLELNTDYPRGKVQSFSGASLYDFIDIKLHRKICDKCKELGITPFVFYMASFYVLLSKFSGSEDIVVGTPISGRSSDYLDTVGMFVNTVAIRNRPEAIKTVKDFLFEVKKNSVEAIANQNYPFGKLVKLLGIQPSNRNPLYDVVIAFQSDKQTDIIFGDKKAELIPTPLKTAKNDLSFYIMPREDDVVLLAEYCTDLFSEKTVSRFAESFRFVLAQMIDTQKNISEVSVGGEVSCLTGEFAERKKTDTIYSLFEKQIHGRENEICIETSNSNITFKKFEALVSALDGEIQKHTLGKKQTVAVLCERSIEMYLSIYAVIRGGNAYLPISPDFPKERIEYILKDSGSCLLLAQDGFVNLAKDSVPVFNVSEFLKDENSLTHEALPSRAEPEDTAYVIYTSGSTGNPKGAKISHRSAVNRILWMQKKYPLEQDSVILQKTPYTFDVSVWEHFWWGMCSGHLAVSNPNEHFLPAKILEDCFKFKVTHLHFVPSVFKLFLDYLESHRENISNFASVKYVFLSGEALEAELIKRFYALFEIQKVKLANLYGPTECAVDVTYYDCLGTETDPVPIGKPIDNTSIYILDKYKKIVPLGVKGEIYIGGENVGQGYLNNEKLTKEKFTENPFEGGKLYKTGDYGFIRDDGQIVFLGRIDNQVKLGGQRIELGEIENAIMSIDGISSAAVLLKKDSVHEYLVAFYFGQKQNDDFILQKLSASLPKYMIPKFILFKEEMPLNPSGKLDRKVLEKIEIEIQSSEEKKEEPINGLEKMICRAFSEILKTPNVGRNSDFTLLGGTSLDIIKLLSKDEFAFLKAHDIIAHPTPRALASFIEEKTESSFKFLHPLHFQNAKKSIVIFPFAGGNANSFLAFCEAIKHNCSEVNIYFCDYLHSFEDCKKLSEEIFELSKTSEIYFYSHCVGSSIALETIKILEKENKSIVKHFISAASIPQKTPFGRNIWNFVSDKMLKSILASAGSKLGGLEKETQNEILKAFRNDTDFSTEILFRFKEKINCPVTVIISPDDIFTKNYKGAKKKWEKFSVNTPDVLLIDSKSHYFQTENAAELSKMIAKIIK